MSDDDERELTDAERDMAEVLREMAESPLGQVLASYLPEPEHLATKIFPQGGEPHMMTWGKNKP